MERINSYQPVHQGYQSLSEKEARTEEEQQNKSQDRVTLGSEQPVQTYDRTGKVNGSEKSTTPVTLQQIEIEIAQQAYLLLKDAAGESGDANSLNDLLSSLGEKSGRPDDPLGLGAYFSAHPNDWRQVQAGIVPDHFNVENTGQRILDIWKQSLTEETDVNAWVANTKEMIGQAYSDVEGMLGSLPQLVLDTRDYIMNELDNMTVENSQETPVETMM